ncbi:MAG TPA: UDP-N-acetylglucosamine--N-acetylmuramyl-(pentapeptide) pyrophosphoryl-undecaprenol N-acetylglucosamine transferase, partial [Phycisphaerales bacterium]|nr:UDP-N-acetylglucosamine--N-acetylmuramyl-(pentapeptide) pyrophosphoryl-undecaprenol N-acetylglucosamine transferase [Phycisphaerales bacterium]
MTGRPVIFAGGGTGGHILPGLAIAERLPPETRTHFICSDRPLDAELLRRAVVAGDSDPFTAIPARPFGLRPRAALRLASTWGACVRTVRGVIRTLHTETNQPPVLVAMGGFVSAPAVRAAMSERCPVVLVNLDAAAGLANRWIARRATRCYAVAAAPPRPRGVSWRLINPIVRGGFSDLPAPAEARARFGLDPDAPTLLVTGGSQGARTINALLGAFFSATPGTGWQVIHQCGRDDPGDLRAVYAQAGCASHVEPFIDDMPAAWSAADLAVSRAGAGSVAEVWATGTPTIFLPYPHHADGHQRLNALPLERAGGAVIFDDLIDPERNLAAVSPTLRALLDDPKRRQA